MSSVHSSLETATDTMTDLLKGRVRSRRLAAMSSLLVSRGAQRQSFWRLMGDATVNTFSSEKQMNERRLSGNLFSNVFARLNLVIQLASVNFCARRFLTHSKGKSE